MRSYGSEAERHVSNPDEAARESRDRTWFEHQVRSTSEFWNRIGLDLDVAQAHVLDLGCGLGALSVELAQRGAQSVLGLDIDPPFCRVCPQVRSQHLCITWQQDTVCLR